MQLSWAFDVISPYAYLGLKQLSLLPPKVEIRFVPVLFAGLLNHHGQIGNAEIPSKRRFTYRFALWRARKLGIPFTMPPAHPFNPLAAQRLIIAAGANRRAVEAAFDFVFQRGLDVSQPAVLADLGRVLGINDVPTAVSDPEVKARLRENTEWAITRGVFGVPTLIAGEELFWGHDAVEMAATYVRSPSEFEDAQMRAVSDLPVGASRQPR